MAKPSELSRAKMIARRYEHFHRQEAARIEDPTLKKQYLFWAREEAYRAQRLDQCIRDEMCLVSDGNTGI